MRVLVTPCLLKYEDQLDKSGGHNGKLGVKCTIVVEEGSKNMVDSNQ